MPNSCTDPLDAFLGDLFLRLVERVRYLGGPTWARMRDTTTGREGVIVLDGHRLRMRADAGAPYRVHVASDTSGAAYHFNGTGDTIVDILRGRTTLAGALTEGRIDVRAALPDLLGIYLLMTNILADSATDAVLRELCVKFEARWPYLSTDRPVRPVADQVSSIGVLIRGIRYEHWSNGGR